MVGCDMQLSGCTFGVAIVNALTMCLVDLPRTICGLFAVLLMRRNSCLALVDPVLFTETTVEV
jgi:hypothetical protein